RCEDAAGRVHWVGDDEQLRAAQCLREGVHREPDMAAVRPGWHPANCSPAVQKTDTKDGRRGVKEDDPIARIDERIDRSGECSSRAVRDEHFFGWVVFGPVIELELGCQLRA